MPTGIRRLLIVLPLASLLSLSLPVVSMGAADPAAVQEKIQEAVPDAGQRAEWKKMRADAREQIKAALRAPAG